MASNVTYDKENKEVTSDFAWSFSYCGDRLQWADPETSKQETVETANVKSPFIFFCSQSTYFVSQVFKERLGKS